MVLIIDWATLAEIVAAIAALIAAILKLFISCN